MANSRQLAGLLGPTLVVLSISEKLNLGIWTSIAPETLAPIVYLNGILLFVGGLAIVRAHNLWPFGWPVLVTLVGWVLLVGGLLRMFRPTAGALPADANQAGVYTMFGVILLIGVVLTFNGYRRPGAAER